LTFIFTGLKRLFHFLLTPKKNLRFSRRGGLTYGVLKYYIKRPVIVQGKTPNRAEKKHHFLRLLYQYKSPITQLPLFL
jgi:hypothetical protein